MRFWDASALVPLLTPSPESAVLHSLLRKDADVLVWWGSLVECESALRRQERDGDLLLDHAAAARARLRVWLAGWSEIQPGDRLREIAVRLMAVHPLRAGDGFQLAAALTAARGTPSAFPFVSLDRRLSDAAAREGFEVISAA